MSDVSYTAEGARIAAEATMGKAALGTTLTGSATAIYGGYTLNEMAMIVGAIAALGGLLVQIAVQWHAWQGRREESQREKEKAQWDKEWHQTRMAALRNRAALKPDDAAFLFQESREGGEQ